MPILFFLKSIPLRDWKYIAILVATLAFTAWVYHRGEGHVREADARAVQAQIVHNTEVENVVKQKVAKALAEYHALEPLPVPVPVAHLVCHSAGAVPSGGSPTKGSNDSGAAAALDTGGADAGFDPAPLVSATGIEADVTILHLLAKVKLLQETIRAYQAGGMVAK